MADDIVGEDGYAFDEADIYGAGDSPISNVVLLNCSECGNSFFRRISQLSIAGHDFCSRECYLKWIRKPENKKVLWNYQEWVNKKCGTCGKEYSVARRFAKSRYCSRRCKGKAHSIWMSKNNPSKRLVKYVSCGNCGNYFRVPKSRVARSKNGIFCSYACWHEYLLNHPWINKLWKGGRSGARMGREWYRYRLRTLKRDYYTCKVCGATKQDSKVKIVVHHIIIYKVSKSHDLENLITLCRTCHYRVHRLAGWAVDTRPALNIIIYQWDMNKIEEGKP